MQESIIDHPLLNRIFPFIGRLGLTMLGWKTKGGPPALKKYVLICAPHSSNWDFVFFLLMIFKFRLPVHWMGKASMFSPPFRSLLRRLGGIPIDRSRSGDTVSQMASAFETSDRLIIALAPSGTRRKVTAWKTGFYHLACQAGVPIVCGYVDYRKKTGGIGPVFTPTGEIAREIKEIRLFYRDKSGRA